MEDSTGKGGSAASTSIASVFANILNFFLLLTRPRAYFRFRWSATFSLKDAFKFVGQYASYQFTAIYGRITARYKYHPLQQHEQKIRKFDLGSSLSARLSHFGNKAFYDAVLSPSFITGGSSSSSQSCEADLTKLQDVSTVSQSADLVYKHAYFIYSNKANGVNLAKLARMTYLAGFSRPVDAFDNKDWEKLRSELRTGTHNKPFSEDMLDHKIVTVALSYKGKESKITRRMRQIDENNEPQDGRNEQITNVLTADFVDDFRWSQVVRTCKGLARKKNVKHIRIWIDRLIGMGLNPKRKEHGKEPPEDDELKALRNELNLAKYKNLNEARSKELNWEDYGLFPYVVCPVVRVYQRDEASFGTDFWRKLETVLGVAGSGLMVDDYMLKKYDNTIYFASSMYQRLDHGVSLIGGGGTYLRSVTLALATAILSDGVSVSAVNEDIRTKDSVKGWKAWALRTIAEGAYSADHPCMMHSEEDAFVVGKREFMTLAFWESLVVQCDQLEGKSYLDMSYQRSMSWKRSSCWDGITEWIGMIEESCNIQEPEVIRSFLNENVKMEVWTAPTGHVAAWLRMTMDKERFQRSLVVDLTRFSMISEGHVTAVAEATGLRGKSLMPGYLRFKPEPDNDQEAQVVDQELRFVYKPMKVELIFMPFLRIAICIAIIVVFFAIPIAKSGSGTSGGTSGIGGIITAILVFFAIIVTIIFGLLFLSRSRLWLWYDKSDTGEGLFDNLLLHSLYDSGIKLAYRKLRHAEYGEIGWTGADWRPTVQKSSDLEKN